MKNNNERALFNTAACQFEDKPLFFKMIYMTFDQV